MSPINVVILAAGQGSRLSSLTNNCPKPLIPFDGIPLLLRTVRQLQKIGFSAQHIVVGHMQNAIKDVLRESHDSIIFIHNEKYAIDTNSLSLHLALSEISSPVLIVEADVVLSDACLPLIRQACSGIASTWFTHGQFKPHQIGGIIKSDANNKIIDMQIVPAYETKYADYTKNLGMVYIGPHELDFFKKKLAEGVSASSHFYYMDYWIRHLAQLPCVECNLFPHPAGSFNTVEELDYCRQLMLEGDNVCI